MAESGGRIPREVLAASRRRHRLSPLWYCGPLDKAKSTPALVSASANGCVVRWFYADGSIKYTSYLTQRGARRVAQKAQEEAGRG